MSFKALPIKIQRSKNRQSGSTMCSPPSHPTPHNSGKLAVRKGFLQAYRFVTLIKKRLCHRVFLYEKVLNDCFFTKKSFFTFKINQNKKGMISIISIRHRIFDIVSTSRYDALWLYGRYSDVDEAKELMSNFI